MTTKLSYYLDFENYFKRLLQLIKNSLIGKPSPSTSSDPSSAPTDENLILEVINKSL
jgi:hypothetical protein